MSKGNGGRHGRRNAGEESRNDLSNLLSGGRANSAVNMGRSVRGRKEGREKIVGGERRQELGDGYLQTENKKHWEKENTLS